MPGPEESLPAWLLPLGDRPVRYFRQIGSTNSEAVVWAQAGAPFGAVVIAEEQTAGRGRQGRAWIAAPGSALLMSAVLRVDLPPEKLGRIPLLGAVALVEVLGKLGLECRIKWPNDVLINGRKVAGILAEAAWQGELPVAVVLGIGVNVLRGALSPADAVAFHATTVEDALDQTPSRGKLLARLLQCVDDWLPRANDPALLTAWRRSSSTLGQQISVQQGGRTLVGVAEDIDDSGALVLRTADAQRHALTAGDVTLHGEPNR